MKTTSSRQRTLWRLVVVGGHTRSIGKTQLVCDVIRAFPRTAWIAGKITQYGHGVCARDGENCDCAPTEHVCALDWETRSDSGTDSARFLEAGARRSFWLRTKQGYLAEGLPVLRQALEEVASSEWRVASEDEEKKAGKEESLSSGHSSAAGGASEEREKSESQFSRTVIVESNSLLQFLKPSLYFAVIDPLKEDFKESAQMALDRAHALVLRGEIGGDGSPAPLWMKLPAQLMRERPSVVQREGEPLPAPLRELVHRILEESPGVTV